MRAGVHLYRDLPSQDLCSALLKFSYAYDILEYTVDEFLKDGLPKKLYRMFLESLNFDMPELSIMTNNMRKFSSK